MGISKENQLKRLTGKKKPRSKKVTAIKKTAWGWFSKYIRLRDCLFTTGDPDFCICVTCGAYTSWDKLQAGHAIGGRDNSILFDEELVNGQCEHCNRSVDYGGLGGNYPAYYIWFVNKYGFDRFKEKESLRRLEKKLSYEDYKNIASKYRLKYKELCSTA